MQSKLANYLVIAAAAAAGFAVAQSAAESAAAPLPQSLRDAGLFVPGSTSEILPELLPFSPQYPLWSDGATKRRWLHLPPGTFIDAAKPDAWQFPPGTRLWKEFSLERRIETRLIERLADGSWRYATYVWDEDDRDAQLAPADGIRALPRADAPGGRYTIPSDGDCRACHEAAAVPVLGFSALQLSADRDPAAPHAEPVGANQLQAIVELGRLRNLPAELVEQPPQIAAASPVERAALGYLHGNCGHCHSAPGSSDAAVPVPVQLAQSVADPIASAQSVLRSLLDARSRFRLAGADERTRVVAPGSAAQSVLPTRMRSRDPRVQMPPLGTAVSDHEALALIERWIDDLPNRKEDSQ
jgi:hypothetical protein